MTSPNEGLVLFDETFYLSQKPTDFNPGESALEHYLRVGSSSGFDPHPMFWTDFYSERYGSLIKEQNPLLHFLAEGWKLGLDPNPFFSTRQYEEMFPDIREHEINPAVHYALHGGLEIQRSPTAGFYAGAYAQRRKLATGVNPLVDFIIRLRRIAVVQKDKVVPESPDYSVIILNFNKALLTLQCVLEVLESRDASSIEIIVVDNGSGADDMQLLSRWMPRGVRIVRLSTNRFFGEGNNIGVEASRGRFVLFLNNDAFIEPTTLRDLTAVLDAHPDAGAAGPKFLYTDGRIQEAGGFLSSCGIVTQRAKFLQNINKRYDGTEIVDYISAACILVPRVYLDAIAGFDLAFEPAYYEDVDLCYKLRLLGLRTYYCGAATVTHIENATSGDRTLGLELNDIIAINREKFIARWEKFIISDDLRDATVRLSEDPRGREESDQPYKKPVALIMTPYHLIPGGGERYILSIAETLSREYRTILVTPERYSRYRLRQLGSELDLDLSQIDHITVKKMSQFADCDLYISIGNELLPQSRGMGKRRMYVCQFPFPMAAGHIAHAWDDLQTYDAVVVYSKFAARCYEQRGREILDRLPPIHILSPSVPMYSSASPKRPGRIVNVGRFTSEGHCKRQDTLIEAFRRLAEIWRFEDLELHLVGTVPPDARSRGYFSELTRQASGLRVTFHVSASPQKIQELYETSAFYWHATGYGRSERLNPELMEHFGITVMEAMSAGAIPLVYQAGGPAEMVAHGVDGYHWKAVDELVDLNLSLLENVTEATRLRNAGVSAARRFDRAAFDHNLLALLDQVGERSRKPASFG